MDPEARRELTLLEAVSEDGGHVTQRSLSARLGVALGLTNIYLKRLVRKGYIKCVNVQSNRLLYLITPAGIAEKTRLTYEYMQYSLQLYGQARQRLRTVLEPHVASGQARIAIYGTGEAAELAYLCLKELGVEPVAVFAPESGGTFVGLPIESVSRHDRFAFDLLVLAMLDEPAGLFADLEACGVPATKIVPLRPLEATAVSVPHVAREKRRV